MSPLREESDSSGDNYQRQRNKKNRVVKRSRVTSKMRSQQSLQRLDQLRAEKKILKEKIQHLEKEIDFIKVLFMAYLKNHKLNFSNLS